MLAAAILLESRAVELLASHADVLRVSSRNHFLRDETLRTSAWEAIELSVEKQKHAKSGSKATGGFVVLFFYYSYVR